MDVVIVYSSFNLRPLPCNDMSIHYALKVKTQQVVFSASVAVVGCLSVFKHAIVIDVASKLSGQFMSLIDILWHFTVVTREQN